MKQLPISLITIFHPEKILDVGYKHLKQLPCLRKNRIEQEEIKELIANEQDREMDKRVIHGRSVLNFGSAQHRLRMSFLDGAVLWKIIKDYSTRLIFTEQEQGQAAYKLEVRPNWGDEPNILPDEMLVRMRDYLCSNRMSVRQLWINPFTRYDVAEFKGPYYNSAQTVNIILGPFDNSQMARSAKLHFSKLPRYTSIHQHYPFYRKAVLETELKMVEKCNLWFLEIA